MELDYDAMVNFLKDYFPVYSEKGQDPATVDIMEDFYSPDFEFIGYVGLPNGPLVISGREAFKDLELSHPSSYERLTPEDFSVDEKRKVVFVIIKFEGINKKTNEVLVTEKGVSQYHLVLDENEKIKIKKIVFFSERRPKESMTIADLLLNEMPDP